MSIILIKTNDLAMHKRKAWLAVYKPNKLPLRLRVMLLCI